MTHVIESGRDPSEVMDAESVKHRRRIIETIWSDPQSFMVQILDEIVDIVLHLAADQSATELRGLVRSSVYRTIADAVESRAAATRAAQPGHHRDESST